MATRHQDVSIAILSAERSGGGIIIDFSDGTTTFFHTYFYTKVNVALTNMSDEDLMEGFRK